MRTLALAFATCCALPTSALAQAAPRPVRYDVRASLEDGDLSVVTQITVERPSSTAELRFWFYSDRLAETPRALNQRNSRWIFPREVDLAAVRAVEVEVDGRPVAHQTLRGLDGSDRGRDVAGSDITVAVTPGQQALHVTIRHRQRIPERFGRLGAVGERVTLAGPWYPLLVAGDAHHFDVPHRVRLCTPSELHSIDPQAESAGQNGQSCHERAGVQEYMPFFLAHDWYPRRVTTPTQTLTIWSDRELYRPPPSSAPGVLGLHDIAAVDVAGHIARVADGVLATLRLAGVPPRRDALHVVLSPSRTELAANTPGLVAVSDRLFEIFPHPALRALHDRALSRALFRWHLAPLVDRVDTPIDRDWSEDLRAVLLTDADLRRQSGEVTTPEDLLGWAGFHPAVDQLLYAPQVAFTDTLFGVVDEPDPFREAPERSRRTMVRGRRLLEHARDRIPAEAFDAWSKALLSFERSAREALRALAPEAPLDEWIDSPRLAVNYRLGRVTSTRSGSGFVHQVEVIRDGADRHEPVEVRLVDREGNVHTETWDGSGDRGVVEFHTDSGRREITVDPRGRLPQDARLAGGHPLRDDTDSLRLRPPIVQGVNVSLSSEGQFIGLLDVVVRRRYDLENTVGLRLSTDPRSRSALLRYIRGVGRKRDNNARVGSLSFGVQFERLLDGFVSGEEGGYRTGLLFTGVFSDQRFFLDPRSGAILIGSLRASITKRDDGSLSTSLVPSLRGNLTLPIGLRTAVVLVAGGAYVFGQPIATELAGLGGRFFLRGYETDELVGRGIAYAVGELRFTPTAFSDLRLNAIHAAWVREIQLAVFAGGGALFSPRNGGQVDYAAEVGGGIRVHFDYAGVQPGVLVLDVAVPLLRDAETRRGRRPATVFVAFEQFF